MHVETTRPAALVASIRAPWRATVGECLRRWQTLDSEAKAHSYIVLEGEVPGVRHTLNSSSIKQLVAASSSSR